MATSPPRNRTRRGFCPPSSPTHHTNTEDPAEAGKESTSFEAPHAGCEVVLAGWSLLLPPAYSFQPILFSQKPLAALALTASPLVRPLHCL